MMEELTNTYAKEISSLKLKKYRQSLRKFILEGPKLVREALENTQFPVEAIVGLPGEIENLPFPQNPTCSVYTTTEHKLKSISSLKNHYRILAVLQMPDGESKPEFHGSRWLYLDGVQDPGNVGSIIRSAEWMGWNGILLGPGTVDPLNPKVVQSSMGSILRVPFIEADEEDLLALSQKGFLVVAASMKGLSPEQLKGEDQSLVLIIGNEGRGISPEIADLVHEQVHLPAATNSKAESLNAAMSATVLMYVLRE